MPSAIDSHPARRQIIDLLIAKKFTKAAEIAGVTRQAAAQYCNRHLKPSMDLAAKVLQAELQLPKQQHAHKSDNAQVALVNQITRNSVFRERLELVWGETIDSVKAAKNAVKIAVDQDGEQRVIGRDLSVVAPLLGQAHKNLEILGRATGELQDSGSQVSTTINLVCGSAQVAIAAQAGQVAVQAEDDSAEISAGPIDL